VRSSVEEEARQPRTHCGYGLLREEDRVTGDFGELLDAGSDVDRVADQGELELASTADGSRRSPHRC
jgi:hypothetical protein